MSRSSAVAQHGEMRGPAYTLGWRLFLAFVGVTPLVVGVLPPQTGSLALVQAYDPVSLPKVVALLVLVGLSLAALCVGVARGESELRWHPVLWILVALAGWAGVTTLFAASRAVAIWGAYLRNEGLAAIVGYGLVAFLAIQYVRSIRDLRRVMVVAVASGSLVSAYALAQFAGLELIDWAQTWRVVSTFGNADMLGDYLVFPFALALGLALSERGRRYSLGWWAAAALIAAALAASETRGAWIAVLVLVPCMVWTGWNRLTQASRPVRLAIAGVAVVLLAGAATAVALTLRGPTEASSSLPVLLSEVSNGRTVIWSTGLRGWLLRPVTGWGPDGFINAFESSVGPDWYATLSRGGVGFGSADNAHNLLVQALVTLGVPGLALTMWALLGAAVGSYRGLRTASGRGRLLVASVWASLAGMLVALSFGVTTPYVSVWLWLTVGLLVASTSTRITAPPRAVLATVTALGVTLALWAGSWLVADVMVGWAMRQEAGPAQVSALEGAARLNPLSPRYRWLAGEALANQAAAQSRAGQSRETVDATMLRAISEYQASAAADRGDVLVRIALANVLARYASDGSSGDASRRSVEVALEAVEIGPRDVAALVALARAYEAAGSRDQAGQIARLARSIAPGYAGQALGSLGLDALAP